MMRVFRTGAIALCILLCAGSARAAEVHAGVTSAFTFGAHDESQNGERVPLLPLPLLTLRVRLHRFEIAAEGIPPIGPVPYRTHSYVDTQTTLLSYAQAVLRYRFGRYLSAGIGETLYNQRTTYQTIRQFHGTGEMPGYAPAPVTLTDTDTQVDASRVPGLRLELRGRWDLGPRQWLSAGIAVTPAMHAVVRTSMRHQTTFQTTLPFGQPPAYTQHYAASELGSQVDAEITAGRRFGPYTLLYGVRYLNYVAHFTQSGSLADRNTLLLPFVGFERAFGR